jgi:hypothetical protein
MTNNPPLGYHPNNPRVLSCKQQIVALSKVCNVNNTIILEQKIVVFSLVANVLDEELRIGGRGRWMNSMVGFQTNKANIVY